jgi:hypothetical protein
VHGLRGGRGQLSLADLTAQPAGRKGIRPHLGVVCYPRRRSRFGAGSEERMHIINSMIPVVLGLHSVWTLIVLITLGG